MNGALSIDGYQIQWVKDKLADAGPRAELSIDERRRLAHYVPPGSAGRHLRNFSDFGYKKRTYVPSASGDNQRLQEALIDAMPANDNIHLTKLQGLSLADAERYANGLIADENFMQGFKQMNRLQQLELGAAIIFALRNGGMTEVEADFQKWFVNNQ